MKKLTFILFFLLAGNVSLAQPDPTFHHLNTANGLSNNHVRCILQDSRGFLWFGTDAGLNRYDGKEFLIYKNIPGDSTSISGMEIRDFLEDENSRPDSIGGKLWIATADGGLNSYDFRTAKFQHYPIIKNGSENPDFNKIASIAPAEKGKLWIGTEQSGLYLFDEKTNSFELRSQAFPDTSKKKINPAYAFFDIQKDSDGNVYFGTLAYSLEVLKSFSALKGKPARERESQGGGEQQFIFTHPGKNYPYPAHTINTICIDSRHRIWLGGWDNALHEYFPETNLISTILLDKNEPLTFSGNEILSIAEDKNTRPDSIGEMLWIGSRKNGLYLYDPATGVFENFRKNQNDPQSLSSNTVRCIYRDDAGRMWLGTDAGIDVYDPLLHQFEIISLKDLAQDGGDDETVNDFFRDGKTFYIATSRGLLVRTGEFLRHSFSYLNEPLSITKIFKDKEGILYLGTNKTVFVFDPEKGTINTFNSAFQRKEEKLDFFNLSSSRVVSITEGRWNDHDVLWICPYGHGIGVFDKKNLSGFVSVLNIPDNSENLAHKVFVDSKNNNWVLGNTKGLGYGIYCRDSSGLKNLWSQKHPGASVRFDSALLRAKSFNINKDDSTSLHSTSLFDMIENSDGTYWITSQSDGLILFNPHGGGKSGGAFTSYPSDHSDMGGLLKDRSGNLWIIVSGGIEFFDVKKKKFHFFGAKDGIPNEGVHGYFYQDTDGFAYAAGNGFYLRFKPEAIQFNQSAPKISFTHFSIFDQPADEFLLGKEIDLSYRQNFFSFEFAALNFTDPDQNQYAYMLEGVDQDWVRSGNRNFASYTNLHGGHYVFRVKAANNNGVWNEAGMSIPIYIKPPLWQYAWFYPSLILILAATGFLIYRNRVQRLHKQQEDKLRTEIEAQEQERVRIAQDLHDDFGTRISALKIYMSTLEKYLDTKSEEAKAVKESAKSMVNEAMSDLRTLLMNLSPKTLELHGYHAAVHDLVNRLNHTGMFEVELDVAPALNRFDKKYELALYRISQELLNNSIKHAQCSEISIQLLQRDNLLVLTYSDNGKGFDKSQLREKGFGLKNIENRVQLIGGKINWDTNPGSGVNVTIEIPYLNDSGSS